MVNTAIIREPETMQLIDDADDEGSFKDISFLARFKLLLTAGLGMTGLILIGIIAFWCASLNNRPLLILISIDGAKPDYIHRGLTPTISKLARDGQYFVMKPSFPTITFPNHYTLVTGLHPAHHGLVANSFYDPIKNATFQYTDPLDNKDPDWWLAEPIWTTAIKQNLICGTLFWPGSEHVHDGILPHHWLTYNNSMDINEKVDILLTWTRLNPRPDFLTVYIPDVDHAGHEFGPDSEMVDNSLRNVDNGIAKLLGGLEKQGLNELTNLVIVSDHGMTTQSPQKVVILNEIIDTTTCNIYFNGAIVMIEPRDSSKIHDVYNKLYSQADGRYFAWLKDQVPIEYHFNSNRVSSIVLEARNNFAILENKNSWIGKGN